MKLKRIFLFLILLGINFSCKDYLDVVPDNIATIDNAFSSRTTAEKFLFTCYGYMPEHGNTHQAAFTISDEFWLPYPQLPEVYFNQPFEDLARNRQNMVNPTLNFWDGSRGGKPMFRAIRDCNIFLENIAAVPGIPDIERKRWIAEVKFLKAYYHFWLLRQYGPIPLMKVNIPIHAGVEEVKVKREPVDACFDYIVQLLDEASPDLPNLIPNETSELGRITQPIALTVKASILVTAASPLFNGNSEFAGFADKDGQLLFNATYKAEKWKAALDACSEAAIACETAGLTLYKYAPIVNTNNLSPSTLIQMSTRNSVTEKWNSEIIWANTNSMASQIQALSQAHVDPTKVNNLGVKAILAPTLKMAELFYTRNGVPIDEDNDWDYAARYTLKTATAADAFNIQSGYTTAYLHFNRENRFYSGLSFDGSYWYGQGKYDDKDPWIIKAKANQAAGKKGIAGYTVTGYLPKKLVHFQNIIEAGDGASYTVKPYPWPVFRLADLYLLYAEALNEYAGPSPEAYKWIDLVRARAGLKTVQESWSMHSRLSSKHTTKEGLRDIIQHERQIELAFEGKRYWDVMRWKKGRELFNQPVQGWDTDQELAENYYRVTTLFNRTFRTKDYFWPISENNLVINNKLVQNPGW